MSNFKYSQKIYGSLDIRKKFIEDIKELGYKEYYHDNPLENDSNQYIYLGFIRDNIFDHFKGGGSSTDYTFNIDQECIYKIALAIAAIRVDNYNFYPGELVRFEPKHLSCNITNGSIAIVRGKIERPKDHYDMNGLTEPYLDVKWLMGILRENLQIVYNNVPQNDGGYNHTNFVKLTPEEIIEFFTPKNIETMSKKFKKGDKVKIPKTKQGVNYGDNYEEFLEEIKDYKLPYLIIDDDYDDHGNVGIDRCDNGYITTNSFHENDLELYVEQEYTLPKTWSVKGGHELKNFIKELEEKEGKTWTSLYAGNSMDSYYNFDGKRLANYSAVAKYDIVTVDQLRQYYFKEKQSIKMENKIIGYKAPMDLAGGAIKAGTIFVGYGQHKAVANVNYYYEKYNDENVASTGIPKEIVETWKPVYEEDYKVGDWVVVLDTPNVRSYNANVIGKVFQLDEGDGDQDINALNEGNIYIPFNNKHYTNFVKKDFRRAKEQEIEENKIILLTVGSNNTEVEISKKGIEARGCWLEISVLKEILNRYSTRGDGLKHLATWPVVPDRSVRFILIGCNIENNLYSLKEISRVIDAYEELNK